ncbi:MAG TPA: pilus assembly protein TadG-related protein, partial [Desulfosporosinus sp.]|nr:pilus assembly protein TadG-related protein [Desulfosporosinus sp.]
MMKINNRFSKFEKAQVMPALLVALIILIVFAALIIDGGSIMLNRRTAQASADAGAMAGARELCFSTGADPLDVARNYALINEAATAAAQLDNGLVSVNTSVINDSFFAKIINENSLDAGAEAAAGCFSPDGNYLMPIAWSCRPSLGGESPFDPGMDCKIMALDWLGLLEPLVERTTSTIEIP